MRNCDENLGGVGENIQCHKSMTQYCVFFNKTPLLKLDSALFRVGPVKKHPVGTQGNVPSIESISSQKQN